MRDIDIKHHDFEPVIHPDYRKKIGDTLNHAKKTQRKQALDAIWIDKKNTVWLYREYRTGKPVTG